MKKITLFIASLFVAMAMFAEIKVDTLWQKTTANGLPTTDSKPTGIAYDNGQLLVPTRLGGDTVANIYDAATGNQLFETDGITPKRVLISGLGAGCKDYGADFVTDDNGAVYYYQRISNQVYKRGADGTFSAFGGTFASGWNVNCIDVYVDANNNGCVVAPRNNGAIYYLPITAGVAGEWKTFTQTTGSKTQVRANIVDATHIWIDGTETLPVLVTLNSDLSAIESEKVITSAMINPGVCGVEQVSVSGYDYLICAANNHSTTFEAPNHSFVIFQLNEDGSVTPVTGYIPAQNWTENKSDSFHFLETTSVVKGSEVTIYVVAGYNGLAAYKLSGFPENSGVIEVTTMAELKANEGKRVLYKGLEPAVVEFDSFWGTEYEYYMPDSTTAFNYSGYVIPAKMDVYGTYNSAYVADEWSEATPTFVIDSVAVIYAFNNMGDLVNFVENEATEAQKAASYEVKKPAVVTLSSMFSFYVQYEAQSRWGGASWQGLMVQIGRMSMFQTKAGDAVQLKGTYTPAVYDENDVMQQPAFFALETGTVVSENNKLNYASINLSETGLKYASEYYASFGRLSKGGKIIEHNYAYYYVVSYVDYVQNGNMYDEVSVTDSLQLMVAGPVDLDSYIGKELDKFIVGVLDYDAYSAAPIFYVTELQESKLYYDNIAELLAAGAQTDYSMSSVLRNPVLLTYISYNQWAGYTIFVQDATGAIALKGLGVAKEDGDGYDFPYTVVAGDSIKGVEGFTTFGEVAAFMWSGDEYVSGLKLEKVSEGVITPIDITLAEFNADVALVQDAMMMGDFYLSKYANKVVRVKGLTREDDPEDEKWPYLVQGEEKIKVSTYYWGDIAVPYSIKSLTGIADYTVINGQTASIQPLNAASVEVEGGVNVELVTLTDIYTENGLIVVDGEFQIFTTTGQNVTNMNGNLQSGVYVVRTATAVGKVVVK